MHMYLDLTSDMALFTWSFMVVKSDVGVLNFPGIVLVCTFSCHSGVAFSCFFNPQVSHGAVVLVYAL